MILLWCLFLFLCEIQVKKRGNYIDAYKLHTLLLHYIRASFVSNNTTIQLLPVF